MNQKHYNVKSHLIVRKNHWVNILSFLLIITGSFFISIHFLDFTLDQIDFFSSEARVLNRLVKAINNSDYDQIKTILYLSQENDRTNITNEQIDIFANSLKKPLEIQGQKVSLKEYLKTMKESSLLIIEDNFITFKSLSLLMSANLPGVSFYIENNLIWESGPSELNTIIDSLPPVPIKVNVKINDTSYQNPEDVILDPFSTNQDRRHFVNMNYHKRMLKLSSSYDDTLLYVNDTETEYIIQKEAIEYGPIHFDQGKNILYAKKVFPWGMVQSHTKNILLADKYNHHHFDINPFNQTLIDELTNIIQAFNTEYSIAFNQLDPSYLSVTSNKMFEHVKTQIEENYIKLNRKIKLNLESYDIDYKSFSFNEEDGIFIVKVLVREQYSEAKWYQSQKMPSMKKNQAQWIRYTLIFDELNDRWLIDDWANVK